MTKILLIESATNVCSVALQQDTDIIAVRESTVPNAHSSMLTLFIDELFEETGLKPQDLNTVTISSGPGSYTGLRIGVSTAKAICFALNIPLIAVDTLEAMAHGVKDSHPDFNGLFCPMIDARRMEVYAAFFDHNLNRIRETQANIIGEGDLEKYLKENQVLFFGNATEKAIPAWQNIPSALFDKTFVNSACYLKTLALQKFNKQEFEDLAYYEPFYLKDYIAGKPAIKGLH